MKWIRTPPAAGETLKPNHEIWQQFGKIMFCNLFASIWMVGLRDERGSARPASHQRPYNNNNRKATKMPLGFFIFDGFFFFFRSSLCSHLVFSFVSLLICLMVWESFRGQWLSMTMWLLLLSPFIVLFQQKCHQNNWLHPIRDPTRKHTHKHTNFFIISTLLSLLFCGVWSETIVARFASFNLSDWKKLAKVKWISTLGHSACAYAYPYMWEPRLKIQFCFNLNTITFTCVNCSGGGGRNWRNYYK